MSILHPATGRHPIHTLHRVSVGLLGVFLLVFGVWGLSRHLGFLDADGAVVMGLSTNGLLATVSVVVAVILLASAVRGGPTASAAGVVFGVLFLLSGLVNMVLLGTSMNMLAFRLPNVIFSLTVGVALLLVGAYGRISGGLPPDNPYYHPHGGVPMPDVRTPEQLRSDVLADRELAEAERAVAGHYASPEQRAGVTRAAQYRTMQDRRRAWRSAATEPTN